MKRHIGENIVDQSESEAQIEPIRGVFGSGRDFVSQCEFVLTITHSINQSKSMG